MTGNTIIAVTTALSFLVAILGLLVTHEYIGQLPVVERRETRYYLRTVVTCLSFIGTATLLVLIIVVRRALQP